MGIRKGSLSYNLLLALEKAAGEVFPLEQFTYSGQIRALNGYQKPTKDGAVIMAIRRLRQKGMLDYEKNQDGKIIVGLTEKGNDYLRQIHDGDWDGKYRIVIWDIPERKRIIRNLLRRKLKTWGFMPWQKSVWVSKRNVTIPLRSFIAELNMDKWVAVIETEEPMFGRMFG